MKENLNINPISPINTLEIKTLIENNLTDDLSIESFFKGIESSYYYEINE